MGGPNHETILQYPLSEKCSYLKNGAARVFMSMAVFLSWGGSHRKGSDTLNEQSTELKNNWRIEMWEEDENAVTTLPLTYREIVDAYAKANEYVKEVFDSVRSPFGYESKPTNIGSPIRSSGS